MVEYRNNGSDIYAESFRIIRDESDLERFPADLEPVIVRMIHAAADPLIAEQIAFTPNVASVARAALEAGAPILCDSSMTATGIIGSRLPHNNQIVCKIKDPGLAALAEKLNCTKTAAAVDQWYEEGLMDGAIIAIGNAPTSLFRVLEIVEEKGVKPAAIIGIPVGFVGAAESKAELAANTLGLEFLTLLGRRGGSAIAVAAINAIASRDESTNIHK